MKRIALFMTALVLFAAVLAVCVSASSEPNKVEFVLQPQNYTFPENGTAMYTVKATGKYLRAFWYMEWQGQRYNLTNTSNGTQPWEGYAGESYGAVKVDDNTFSFFFGGIGAELDGAYIWCVVEDGHFDLESQKARITVSGEKSPPEILSIPSEIVVSKGEKAEIRCVARANGGSQLSYLWYETSTGKLENIQAVDRGSETSDFLICDTSSVGTRYYVCGVGSSDGGNAYSSMVKVTVKENANAPRPVIRTQALPSGTVGQSYNAVITTDDPKAELLIYYNPGKANDFEKTGLKLGLDGKISGTPKNAGSYTFTVCSAGEGGEDYFEYTLVINKAVEVTTPVKTEGQTTAASPETTASTPETTAEPEKQTTPEETKVAPEETKGGSTPETDLPTVGADDDSTSDNTIVIILVVVIAVLCTVIGALAGILIGKRK